jgi:hypothetical protein
MNVHSPIFFCTNHPITTGLNLSHPLDTNLLG